MVGCGREHPDGPNKPDASRSSTTGNAPTSAPAWQTDVGSFVSVLRKEVEIRPVGAPGMCLDHAYLGKSVTWDLKYLGIAKDKENTSTNTILLFDLSPYGIGHERRNSSIELKTGIDFTDAQSQKQSFARQAPLSKLLPYWTGGNPAMSPIRIMFQCNNPDELEQWKKYPLNSHVRVKGQIGYTAFYLLIPSPVDGEGVSVLFNGTGFDELRSDQGKTCKMGGFRIDHVVPLIKTQ